MSDTTTRRALLARPREEWPALLASAGARPHHARSLRSWIFTRGTLSPAAMTDLPGSVRQALAAGSPPLLSTSEIERHRAADGTVKLLLALADGECIETVCIPSEAGGATACVSTQVGCSVGCPFCASGLHGLKRNLAAHEIVEQFLHANAVYPLRRAVVMGIGEAGMNLESTLAALDEIHAPEGLGLGARRITISTVGFPAKIRRLAKHPRRYQLAVSLHAANQPLRNRLVPRMSSIPLPALHAALAEYFALSGREFTIEYVLLDGVNDTPSHARELLRWLEGLRAHVNLIPFNPVPEVPFARPRRQAVEGFHGFLQGAGIVATVRWSQGLEGAAACGQLRIKTCRAARD